MQKKKNHEGTYLQLVRADPQEIQQHKEEERQRRVDAIHESAGAQQFNTRLPA